MVPAQGGLGAVCWVRPSGWGAGAVSVPVVCKRQRRSAACVERMERGGVVSPRQPGTCALPDTAPKQDYLQRNWEPHGCRIRGDVAVCPGLPKHEPWLLSATRRLLL